MTILERKQRKYVLRMFPMNAKYVINHGSCAFFSLSRLPPKPSKSATKLSSTSANGTATTALEKVAAVTTEAMALDDVVTSTTNDENYQPSYPPFSIVKSSLLNLWDNNNNNNEQYKSVQYLIPISQWTYDNLHVKIDHLLYSNNKSNIRTNIITLVNTLLQNGHMIDVYSKTYSDNNELDSYTEEQLIKQTKRKYTWMNAMTYLQSLPNSSTTYIQSWRDAREILSYIFLFPTSSSPDSYRYYNHRENNKQQKVTDRYDNDRHSMNTMNVTPPASSAIIFDSNQYHKTSPAFGDFLPFKRNFQLTELEEYKNKVFGLTP